MLEFVIVDVAIIAAIAAYLWGLSRGKALEASVMHALRYRATEAESALHAAHGIARTEREKFERRHAELLTHALAAEEHAAALNAKLDAVREALK